MATKYKQYIGDAVYADIEADGSITLTTESGINITNRIVLEPQVYDALLRWVEWFKASVESDGFDGREVRPNLPRGMDHLYDLYNERQSDHADPT